MRAAAARVFIVDDHPSVRTGIALLLELEEGLTVVGEAASVAEAMELLRQVEMDLVLTDVSLPDGNGIDLTREILAVGNDVTVLVVSMHAEEHYAANALKAGARGYVLKDEAAECLVEAIGTVLSGEVFLSKTMARCMERFH